jgi:uncharacterized membrane protein YphA (DoxX/SURF4 family)
MKIIPAILALQRAVKANAVTGGAGINVERTVGGTRVSVEESPGTGASPDYVGPFKLAWDDATKSVTVTDGGAVASGIAGICLVNGFATAVADATIAVTASGYIILSMGESAPTITVAAAIPDFGYALGYVDVAVETVEEVEVVTLDGLIQYYHTTPQLWNFVECEVFTP